MNTRKLLTAEGFLELGDANWRHELIRGEMIQLPMADMRHSRLSVEIVGGLWSFVKKWDLGSVTGPETGYTVARNPDVVLAPDGAFVSTGRKPDDGMPDTYFEGAPDLVVEIISEPDRYVYVNEKILLYMTAGAQLVWIVDPVSNTVTAYASDGTATLLTMNDDLDGGEVLPGFRVRLAEIFEE